mgnify:CR=1 FL=1
MVKYMQSSKQRRDFIDVTKFALSILIVVIHISPIESLNPRLTPIPENSGPLIFPYFRLSFLQEIWGSGNHRKENR